MGIEFATISLRTDELVPEQKLWRGVLVNALEDTLIKQSDRKSSIYKINAHEWIMLSNPNFEDVCYWSGFEPNKVKEKLLDIIITNYHLGKSMNREFYDVDWSEVEKEDGENSEEPVEEEE
jgi:hypothetical protein